MGTAVGGWADTRGHLPAPWDPHGLVAPAAPGSCSLSPREVPLPGQNSLGTGAAGAVGFLGCTGGDAGAACPWSSKLGRQSLGV